MGVDMSRKSKRAELALTTESRAMRTALVCSKTAPKCEVERVNILVGYADDASISVLIGRVGVGRPLICKCIDKALAASCQ